MAHLVRMFIRGGKSELILEWSVGLPKGGMVWTLTLFALLDKVSVQHAAEANQTIGVRELSGWWWDWRERLRTWAARRLIRRRQSNRSLRLFPLPEMTFVV